MQVQRLLTALVLIDLRRVREDHVEALGKSDAARRKDVEHHRNLTHNVVAEDVLDHEELALTCDRRDHLAVHERKKLGLACQCSTTNAVIGTMGSKIASNRLANIKTRRVVCRLESENALRSSLPRKQPPKALRTRATAA